MHRFARIPLPRVIALVVAGCCWSPGTCAPAADLPPVERYELIEDWSVAAQGPVHLRETHVTATYQLELADVADAATARRALRLRVGDVAVGADVPAQKRSGRLDTRQLPEKLVIDHHELVRPLALWQREFELSFDPEQALCHVAGADAAVRRLDELYDEHLLGSEQDLYTRDFERRRLDADALRNAWKSLFIVPAGDRTPPPQPVSRDLEFTACIPSESWKTTVVLPVTDTVAVKSQPDGALMITKSAVLARTERVETTIGDAAWVYTPQNADRRLTLRIRSDGRVETLNSAATAVLHTTLSLGTDISITMTIRHGQSLTRR